MFNSMFVFNSVPMIAGNLAILLLCNLFGVYISKKDKDIIEASTSIKKRTSLIVCLNAISIVCAIRCPVILSLVLSISAVQAYSDELTMQVYSLLSTVLIVVLFVWVILNKENIIISCVCIITLYMLAKIGAFANGDADCLTAFILAISIAGGDAMEGMLGALFVACMIMFAERLIKKLAQKVKGNRDKLPEKVPFMFHIFVGMAVTSLLSPIF